MQICEILGIEAEHRGGGRETYRDAMAARQVKTAQSQLIGWFSEAIDALPDPFDGVPFQVGLELVSRNVVKDLAARGDSTLLVEELLQCGVHSLMVKCVRPPQGRVMRLCG